tara:strand:+ start:229 stop:591 length:363 start_codon:yes stop_codon:yes gene_type:complete
LARFHLRGATIPGVLGWSAITFWQCLSLIAGASARRVEYGLGGTLLLSALPSTHFAALPTTGRLLSTLLLLTLPRRTKTATHYTLLAATLPNTRLRPTSATLLVLELREPLRIIQKRIRS